MSSEVVIKVSNVSKCYQVYSSPTDRLKQFFLPIQNCFYKNKKQDYFKEFWAVEDISFEVKRGESVGILGRNGSGKSTLLQLICGTLAPTTGEIVTNGRIAALLELGSGFNPEFSGRENVYLNGSILGLSKSQIDDKFDAIAAFADIGDFLDQPVKTYSSGMLVRLAFAVQVQIEPDILVIDEALAVGDALFQKRCFQQIEKLISNGTTLLFVSHDQESVRTLTSKALLLKNGKQQSWGAAPEVVLEYRKQLHDEETKYLSKVTEQLNKRSENITQMPASSRSEKLSFGEGDVLISDVVVLNELDQECNVFYPKDILKIKISCLVKKKIDKLNVGVRIRNKEGIKMYSWGTLNQDMSRIANGEQSSLFWERKFEAAEHFDVTLTCSTPLGMNLYEVQACVSQEDTPDYINQKILHWVDEAHFFQVSMKREQYLFGGVSDLKMIAEW
ncbi:MAG: ABC transporter ATP-binding protein [Gammaproteobacteria bacterium]|nr:MAG: ABC transporter ATP-binding protein [Gammaproteobacteria bacterium]